MENKINIEELILRQLDISLEMKNRLESKAVGYLAVVTLILTILAQFLTKLCDFIVPTWFRILFILSYLFSFLLGFVLLTKYIRMLLPRPISYFDMDELIAFYNNKEKDEYHDKTIIESAQEYNRVNLETMRTVDKLNKNITKEMLLFIIELFADTIMFFTGIALSM